MVKSWFGSLVVFGLLGLAIAGVAMANGALEGDEDAIMVSPSLIVLAKVDTVTVHTNIALSAVVRDAIDLDGALPTAVYADNRGCLVAKFAVADLGLEPGEATLTLIADLKDGDVFIATDVVGVK